MNLLHNHPTRCSNSLGSSRTGMATMSSASCLPLQLRARGRCKFPTSRKTSSKHVSLIPSLSDSDELEFQTNIFRSCAQLFFIVYYKMRASLSRIFVHSRGDWEVIGDVFRGDWEVIGGDWRWLAFIATNAHWKKQRQQWHSLQSRYFIRCEKRRPSEPL